jgi:PEP-CTERM motif
MKKTILAVSALVVLAGGQARAALMYDNGPINGGVDAFTINFGYQVSDSFTMSSATTVTGVQFGLWAAPGDTISSVDWAISTGPTGGGVADGNPPSGIIASGTASTSSVFQNSNGFGYDLDEVNFSLNVPLGVGTYFLSLSNAVMSNGDPGYWDENNGPSSAYQSTIGSLANIDVPNTTGSESFQIYGGSAVPEPSSLTLLSGMGALSLIGYGWRRRRAATA